jgi:hypothetical protein
MEAADNDESRLWSSRQRKAKHGRPLRGVEYPLSYHAMEVTLFGYKGGNLLACNMHMDTIIKHMTSSSRQMFTIVMRTVGH